MKVFVGRKNYVVGGELVIVPHLFMESGATS